jgi:hypothetical protein
VCVYSVQLIFRKDDWVVVGIVELKGRFEFGGLSLYVVF